MATDVENQHPQYDEFISEWSLMRDTYRGERIVKERGLLYLPATSGMIADGMSHTNAPGYRAYNAYRIRALFPGVVRDAVEAMMGAMHHKPPVIELPEQLEPLRKEATLQKESLELLLRRINEEQLITGRVGLFLDLPSGANNATLPYITTYSAERIINWDEIEADGIVQGGLNLVVLQESRYEREGFSWKRQKNFRVLFLSEGIYQVELFRGNSTEIPFVPTIRGNALGQIPFVIVNSKDVVVEPENPPLLGLANLALAIYRGEADYRQALFMQGQDTLVVIGIAENEEFRTGANSAITVPQGGDAKYIGVESSGLSEMRAALENDKGNAAQKGGQMLDSVSRERESGDALRIRVSARTATLNQVALSGAFGLEQLLKIAATWVGADPEEVSISPNLDFVDDALGGEELVKYLTAKSLGAPFSLKSVHAQMQNRGLTTLDFEEELREIEQEPALVELGMPEPDESEPEP